MKLKLITQFYLRSSSVDIKYENLGFVNLQFVDCEDVSLKFESLFTISCEMLHFMYFTVKIKKVSQ